MKEAVDFESSIFSKKGIVQGYFPFGGFQTPQQETVYHTVTAKLVGLLQAKCVEFLGHS